MELVLRDSVIFVVGVAGLRFVVGRLRSILLERPNLDEALLDPQRFQSDDGLLVPAVVHQLPDVEGKLKETIK